MSDDIVGYDELNIEPDADWRDKRVVEQHDCAACDQDHEIAYYPVPDAPLAVGEKTINEHTGECYLLSVGVCPNADRLVGVYATPDGWECPPGCDIEHVDGEP